MKKVTIEKTVKESKYQALDGELFINENDCIKYEQTLNCIIRAKYNKLVVKHLRESDIVIFASDDNYIDIVKLKTKEDIETVIQLIGIVRTLSVESVEDLTENLTKIKNDKEDYLLLYAGNEYDDDLYYGYLGSAKEFLERAKNSIFDSSKKDVKLVFSKEKIEEMLNKPIRIYNPAKNYLENNKTIVINKPLGLEIYW